jgi:predicted SnoaL-like aldol condensation-catalyzing enzyme
MTQKEKPMSNKQKIEETLRTLYEKVLNEGQADLLPSLIYGPYVQHNPLFPNGPEPLMAYLKQAGSIRCEIKRMAIDGDLAFVHVRHPSWAGKEHASVDIFRLNEDGKILEHWDVFQPVPETAANNNTMF